MGHGSFGIVWLEKDEKENDGDMRAVKEVSKRIAERAMIDYKRELAALAKLSKVCLLRPELERPSLLTAMKHNEFFVQLLGWYDNKKSIFISMEYLPLGDLISSFDYNPVVATCNLSIMRKLISHGAAVNGMPEHNQGHTPLHLVKGRQAKEKARILLEAGAKLDAIDKYGKTPLMVAALEDDLDLASFLVERGAKVNARDYNYSSPLLFAARFGQLRMVKLFLKHGADANMTDFNNWSALHWAVVIFGKSYVQNQIVLELLKNGASPDMMNAKGDTPLGLAKSIGQGLPKLIIKGREEYLRAHPPPTKPVPTKPRQGLRSLFSSRR